MSDPDRLAIVEPALLIRINQSYREGMSDVSLYDATRGIWRLGPRREAAEIALAIYGGIVVEVYEIQNWYPAGSTFYETRTFDDVSNRWEFVGRVAPATIRDKYVGKSVADRFKFGAVNPVLYVNVP
ncbi:MAG: hypothetical protein U0Q11_25650 [Vicinamibacterales bacterium]